MDHIYGIPFLQLKFLPHSLFGENKNAAEYKGSSKYLEIKDPADVLENIKTVAQVKKAQEGVLSARRKEILQLFQYKYYREQVPLTLERGEMEQVISTVINPPEDDNESRLIASKILIKLLLDMYCVDGDSASRIILSLFFEMMAQKDPRTKIYAFNLLLNLSVHMNLLEEVTVIGSLESTNVSKLSVMRIQKIQTELFGILHELLLWLLQYDVENPSVWSSGLNCLLFFITEHGQISLPKYKLLDQRLLPVMLDKIDYLSWQVHRKLLRVFTGTLFEGGSLDVAKLAFSCGPKWLVEQYKTTRSVASRYNIFVILFHYILPHVHAHGDRTRCAATFSLLVSIGAPEDLPDLFKYPSQKFVKVAMESIENVVSACSSTPRSPSLTPRKSAPIPIDNKVNGDASTDNILQSPTPASPLAQGMLPISPASSGIVPTTLAHSADIAASLAAVEAFDGLAVNRDDRVAWLEDGGTLDRAFVRSVLSEFHRFATELNRVEDEFQPCMKAMLKEGKVDSIPVLEQLLHSDFEQDRHNGALWLFHILKHKLDGYKVASAVYDKVSAVMDALLTSPNASVRRIFLTVSEKLILLIRSKRTSQKKKLAQIYDLLNENFAKVCKSEEKDNRNLIMIVDLIVRMVSVRKQENGAVIPSLEDGDSELEYLDSFYGEFLQGHLSIATDLLLRVQITLLAHLFEHLDLPSARDAKIVVLIMMIHKCIEEEEQLSLVGGVGFFKHLLVTSIDPQIAFHASRFIMNQVRQEQQYSAVFAQILAQAQLTNNDKLLSNYFVNCGIIAGWLSE
eukprot:TRINITY_DN3730_c0_g1_i4.p1 TRINITY_DN3730_c0_g1~~TRINITY_DN3730_c0_g1_i4.p1  ORF type:complete len:794 (-),score=111.25 TRINITY_DN3730_c0_g1_i4:1047-3428(-)